MVQVPLPIQLGKNSSKIEQIEKFLQMHWQMIKKKKKQ
jgi:hypothetical protein